MFFRIGSSGFRIFITSPYSQGADLHVGVLCITIIQMHMGQLFPSMVKPDAAPSPPRPNKQNTNTWPAPKPGNPQGFVFPIWVSFLYCCLL